VIAELSEAIYSRFENDADTQELRNAVAGMYHGFATLDTASPFITFAVEEVTEEANTDTIIYEATVRFEVWYSGIKADVVTNVLKLLHDAYDECTLNIAGYRFLRAAAKGVGCEVGPEGGWRGEMNLLVSAEKDR